MKKDYILTADIGGTNISFGIVEIPNYKLVKLERKEINNNEEFYQFLNDFLDNKFPVKNACFAIAGPIENKKDKQLVKLTNSDILIDTKTIIEKAKLKNCLFINDYQAISASVNILDEKDIKIINKGTEEKFANKAVIGAGTDLGKSMLFYDKDKKVYIPLSSEGAHADFPIHNKEEFELLEFIKKTRKIDIVRYGEIISGRGIEIIYDYLQQTKHKKQPKKLSAKEISDSRKINPCSKETLELFVKFYARGVKNYVFETLSKAGIYIAGGIAPKNIDIFDNFMVEFTKIDIYKDLLSKIPVKIITNYDISHKGAAFAFFLNN